MSRTDHKGGLDRVLVLEVARVTEAAAIAAASRATPGELQDRQLTARVKAALIAGGEITAKQILIETANSIVSLSGPVDSETMKRATLATARSVHGVVSVLDQLFLRGP